MRGFTVIELVIAIVVGAIVVLAIGSVLARVSQTRDIARARLDAVSRAHTALEALRTDLVSVIRDEDLYNTRVLLLDGMGASALGPSDRDEVLVYNDRLRPMKHDDYQGEGGEYETQYRLQPADGALWMRRDAVPDDNGEGGGMAIPVVDGVVGVSIEAYDGEAWYPDWDSDTMGLPWALRVTVTAAGGDLDDPSKTPPTVTLRTQIPIDRIVPPPPPPEEDPAASPDGTVPGADGMGGQMPGGMPTGGTPADGGAGGGGGMSGPMPVTGGGKPGGGGFTGGGVTGGGGSGPGAGPGGPPVGGGGGGGPFPKPIQNGGGGRGGYINSGGGGGGLGTSAGRGSRG